jgi:hypothetical protein
MAPGPPQPWAPATAVAAAPAAPLRGGTAQSQGRQAAGEAAAAAAAAAAAKALQQAAAASRWPAPLPHSVTAAAAAATAVAPEPTASGTGEAPAHESPACTSLTTGSCAGDSRHGAAAAAPAGGFQRVLFLFDRRDSNLFHVLEDTVRRHNAAALGLARPDTPVPVLLQLRSGPQKLLPGASSPVQQQGGVCGEGVDACSAGALQQQRQQLERNASVLFSCAAAGQGPADASARPEVPATAGRSSLARSSCAGGAPIAARVRPAVAPAAAATAVMCGGPRGGSNAGGMNEQQRPAARGAMRAHFEAGGGASGGSSSDESEAEPSEADMRLGAALVQYKGIALEPRMLQALATVQLGRAGPSTGTQSGEGQSGSAGLEGDIITGFQLVSGKERLVVLEVATGKPQLPAHMPRQQPTPEPAPLDGGAPGSRAATAVAVPAAATATPARATGPGATGITQSGASQKAAAAAEASGKGIPAPVVGAGSAQQQPPSSRGGGAALEAPVSVLGTTAALPPQPPVGAAPLDAAEAPICRWRGAQEVVGDIAAWALAERQPFSVDGWLPRRVLLNPAAAHPARLYAPLGAGLWMVKLRAGVEALGAEAGSYASGRVSGARGNVWATLWGCGPARYLLPFACNRLIITLRTPLRQVRPECVASLSRLMALRRVGWARQADALGLWLTAEQLGLLDKKFGGVTPIIQGSIQSVGGALGQC